VYRPVSTNDPDVRALAQSIEEYGLKEPLVVTLDRFIISGHRRHAACRRLGWETVPCRVEPIRHDDPKFLAMLVEHNRQRVKSLDEVVREKVITTDPADAYTALIKHRKAASTVKGEFLDLGDVKRRKKIGRLKEPMALAIMKIVSDLKDWWPTSDRTVHYNLLNDPPLRNANKKDSRYRNDLKSYKDTCDILTRLRLEGLIPHAAIADPTRKVETWDRERDVGEFVAREMKWFLCLYHRDLQQSQPNHIEVVGEKNTIAGSIHDVCEKFCVPYTIGRGYCSLAPRYEMAQRFKKSGKEKLIVLCLSDFDPEGEDIPESFARSMRDDFGLAVQARKVALTFEQVEERDLPPTFDIKTEGSRYEKFAAKYGDNAHELEAIAPDDLAKLLEAAIDSVMDRKRFNKELDAEKEDAARLAAIRATIMPVIAEATQKSN
jgi:hypothetical protein